MLESKGFYGKLSRVLLLILLCVAAIYFIVTNIAVVANILMVLLGFGMVILVHEFGHFVVAKASGIKVEAFSLFMPPILFGVQRTADGIRFRIFPEILTKGKKNKEGKEEKENDEPPEPMLAFTVGSKGNASDTEYRIGLIPFGGFVKMLGQEDIGSAKSSDDPRSFANKPAQTRAAVLAAGVVFNVISAVIIFMIAFLKGIDLPPAVIGGVLPDSPAALAGLKGGDEVIEIDGKNKDLDFTNIAVAAALSGRNEEIAMRVRHTDGSEENLALVAEQFPGETMKGFGIFQPATLTIARLSEKDANDLFSRTGLRPGDNIKSVDGKFVSTHWELRQIIEGTLAPQVTLSVERTGEDGETDLVESQVRLNSSYTNHYDVESESALSHICSMVPRLRITAIPKKWCSTGSDNDPYLKVGDIILAIGDVENPTYSQMRAVTIEHEDKELFVRVLRTDDREREQILGVTVVPKRPAGRDRVMIGIRVALDIEHPSVAKTINAEGGGTPLDIPSGARITAVNGIAVSSFYDVIREIRQHPPGNRITFDWRLDEQRVGSAAMDVDAGAKLITVKSDFEELTERIPFEALRKKYKANGPVEAVGMGYRRTIMFVAQAYLTLKRLIGGLVSPKNLMGPVGIITASYRIVAEQPLVYYVYFLGLISAVIAVFNFLPLPPLDGGLVVLLVIEKIKGSAISERVQTIIAYGGWALILTLILYVTFNDIVRSFFS